MKHPTAEVRESAYVCMRRCACPCPRTGFMPLALCQVCLHVYSHTRQVDLQTQKTYEGRKDPQSLGRKYTSLAGLCLCVCVYVYKRFVGARRRAAWIKAHSAAMSAGMHVGMCVRIHLCRCVCMHSFTSKMRRYSSKHLYAKYSINACM